LNDVQPQSQAGRYLQLQYGVPDSEDLPRSEVVDAGDGSDYSQAHARNHPYLAGLAEQLGGGDMLLISDEGDIVYSVRKSIDFGTNLLDGPLADTTLALTATEELPRVSAGDSVIADWEIYFPAGGRPAMFIVAAVRRDTDFLGAVAVQVEAEALSTITTANQQWASVGLRSGESYVVGADRILRSESRQWLEDPEAYLDSVDGELADLIATFGSPVGLQPVDTAPVRAALDGQDFEGTSTNYLGEEQFSSATPIDLEGVQWVVVVDTPLSDVRAGLNNYIRRMGIVLAILVALTALFAYGLAVRLARPIPPLVHAAAAVAEGERSPDVGDPGQDELGDLGRRLQRTASELGHHEAELEAEFERRRQMLLSVLPARLINQRGEINESVESVEVVTAISVVVDVISESTTEDDDSFVDTLGDIIERSTADAADRGIEPVRLAADRYLFLAGVGSTSEGANEALDFVSTLSASIQAKARGSEAAVSIHIGLATGPVATGVLEGGGSLTFGAWGEAVRRALAIAALARSDELLLDMTTAEAIDPSRFALQSAKDIISLDGAHLPLKAYSLAQPTTTT
jgi:HAMP domain-containing protein